VRDYDYVQVHFDGSHLTVNATPVVIAMGKRFEHSDPGFKDELWNRIGKECGEGERH
jgi:hypothetical protein